MDPHWLATVTVLLMITQPSIAVVYHQQIKISEEKYLPPKHFRYEERDSVYIDCLVPKSSELAQKSISLIWQRIKDQYNFTMPVISFSLNKSIAFGRRMQVTVNEGNAVNYFCVVKGPDIRNPIMAEVSIGMNGGWSNWSPWSSCSGDCKSATWHRNRTCTNPKPLNLGKKCMGSINNSSSCTPDGCTGVSRWANWYPWSKCSNGKKLRNRICIPVGGNKCTGSNIKIQDCGTSSRPPSTLSKKSGSDPSNLVITVAVSSALIGLLLCVAIIACWRRLHIEQRGTNQRSEDEDATQAILLSLTDSGPGISADNYPEDPALRRELDAVPPGVAFFNAPGSFAEALQGVPPPPNPFFTSPGQETRFDNNSNNNNNREAQAPGGSEGVNEDSSTNQPQQDLQSPEEEFAHLKEGITEDELPIVDNDEDVPPIDII